MLISIPFLLITFFVNAVVPELRNLHGRSLMCYVASLMFLYVLLILSQNCQQYMTGGSVSCRLLASFSYFFSMSFFFWLNVMCYDIYSTFRGRMRENKKRADNKRFAIFSYYAFGSTTLLTLILFFVDEVFDVPKDLKPDMGTVRCLIRDNRFVEFLYVYLPISTISLVNIILFSMTAYKIYICQKEISSMRTEDSQKHSRVKADKEKFYLYLRLFIIMGVTWIMESVSWVFKNSSFMFVFTDALNCLQGFIIFYLFVCKPKMIKLIKKKWESSSFCCSKAKTIHQVTTTHSDVTTKTTSFDDSEARGKFIVDDSRI
ncbi:unnamed protein product [Diamesa hyperborea]